ncbi:tRNA uridine-5-carboxymethylaminomethyl(34) synthesis GTPase MnmE [Candidatus Omnitrophota bacterium]
MINNNNDTIAAVATPPGENGIGIIRLSGPDAIAIAEGVFQSKKSIKLSESKSHALHYGYVVDGQERIDEILLSVMRAPATYTREDVVEINCHGGNIVLRRVLDLIVKRGARIAEPGEFTKRAFLNGRIDLSQAEATLDIIRSRTDESLKVAQRQLGGELALKIKDVRNALMDIMAYVESDINFPDEDLDAIKEDKLKTSLENVKRDLIDLIESSNNGRILRDGITAVICGKTNVGKSSLMNSFLKQDRVIVTPTPGTTRDSIEEIVNVKGIPIRIVDTAGIMHAEDELTRESIERSKHHMMTADLILLVLDSSDELNKQDLDIIDIVKDKKTLVVVNKTDLPEALQIDQIKEHLRKNKILKISVKNKSGLKELEEAIYDMVFSGKVTVENIFLSNSRHIEAGRKALNFVDASLVGLTQKRYWELLSIDIREAAESLGVITGDVFTEDLLDVIFSKFCIGK